MTTKSQKGLKQQQKKNKKNADWIFTRPATRLSQSDGVEWQGLCWWIQKKRNPLKAVESTEYQISESPQQTTMIFQRFCNDTFQRKSRDLERAMPKKFSKKDPILEFSSRRKHQFLKKKKKKKKLLYLKIKGPCGLWYHIKVIDARKTKRLPLDQPYLFIINWEANYSKFPLHWGEYRSIQII